MRMHCGLRNLKFEEIKKYTDNLSEENFIGNFIYGRVFRGRNGDQEFTVKVWDNEEAGGVCEMPREISLLTSRKIKGAPKAIGFSLGENHPCAVIYELKSMDTVCNLIPKDNFSWTNRIKVALGFAVCLRSFHSYRYPYVIRNVDAAHIMCDQEYNPILYDYGFAVGEVYTNMWKYDGRSGSPGYVDPYFIDKRECSEKTDVYAYGIVLLSLISKRVVNVRSDMDTDSLNTWAEEVCKRRIEEGIKRPALVNSKFRKHAYFNFRDARKITKLALNCIAYEPDKRPNMDEVVKRLQGLKVVREHGDETGINKVLDCSEKTDVFVYGIVLLGLISKRVVSDMDTFSLNIWAEEACKRIIEERMKRPALVDSTFCKPEYFNFRDSCKITKLALKCITYDEPDECLKIDEVVRKLQGLKVVRKHGDDTSINKMLECSETTDVFAYGLVLLGLISKRVVNVGSSMNAKSLYTWAEEVCKCIIEEEAGLKRPGLLDLKFSKHAYFNFRDACKLTKLALKCISYEPDEHPMDEVVKKLRALKVVREHGDETCINKVLGRLIKLSYCL